jgi:CheY-like chemotaxis protein
MNSSDEAELMRVVGDWLKPQETLAANATWSHSNSLAALPVTTFPPVQITETSELTTRARDPVRRVSGVQSLQRTVLFVDDDMFILSAYRRNFQSDDFVSEFSLSGVQALNRIRSSRPPDVLVCDVLMPNINGGAVYTEAIALDPTWRRRTVFVSGALDAGLLPPSLSHFHGDVFSKPFNIDGLREAIRRCMVFADGPAQVAAPRR